MGLEAQVEKNPGNNLIQQVLKDSRKSIIDNLKDVLTAADTIFEQGHITRADYHGIEAIEEPTERSSAFVDLLATKENVVLDVLIKYLLGLKDGDFVLGEKLKISKDKFSPKENIGNRVDLKVAAGGVMDSADFTMTSKGLERVQKIVKKNEKALKLWETVLSNMNGLDNFDVHSLKELIGSSRNPFNLQDESAYWNQIIIQTFNLWKERNGPNATFFSLVGIFQESRLISIADSLLDRKEEIQRAPKL